MRTYGETDLRTYKMMSHPRPSAQRHRKARRRKVTALDVVHVHDRLSTAAVAVALSAYHADKIFDRRKAKKAATQARRSH